jgi:HSP20 family protein
MNGFEIGFKTAEIKSNIRNRFESINDEDQFTNKYSERKSFTISDWSRRVDLIEYEDEFLVKVDLPGLDIEDVQVKVDSGILIIFGERRDSDQNRKKVYYRVERQFGAFFRSFCLPSTASVNRIINELKNGVLYIHLYKPNKVLVLIK